VQLFKKYPIAINVNMIPIIGAPSFQLPLDIDSQIAAQMFIAVFALEVGFARINMSFVIVVKVVLDSIVGHGITSLVFLLVSWISSRLIQRYGIIPGRQCESIGRLIIGETYHLQFGS
jgi:hypothetical protein